MAEIGPPVEEEVLKSSYHCPVCDLAVAELEMDALLYDLPCPRCFKNGLNRPSMLSTFQKREYKELIWRTT